MSLSSPFGFYKRQWIAVRTTNTEMLASELRLVNLKSSDCEEGLLESDKIDKKAIFISPPVSGWTLIIGIHLPDANKIDTLPLLVRLSKTHGSAQYFCNHRTVDYYAWAKAEGGHLIRAYAYSDGNIVWNKELTEEEKELGLIFSYPAYPEEDNVIALILQDLQL